MKKSKQRVKDRPGKSEKDRPDKSEKDRPGTQADEQVTGKQHVGNNDSAPVHPGDRPDVKSSMGGRPGKDQKPSKTDAERRQQQEEDKRDYMGSGKRQDDN